MTERFEQQMADLRALSVRPPDLTALMPSLLDHRHLRTDPALLKALQGHVHQPATPAAPLSYAPADDKSAQPVPIEIAPAEQRRAWAAVARVIRWFSGPAAQPRGTA